MKKVEQYNNPFIHSKVKCNKKVINGTNPILESREVLEIKLRTNGCENICVILMNPSKADSQQSDVTINRVIDYFHGENRANTLKVVNLFSIYNSKLSEIGRNISQLIDQLSSKEVTNIIESNLKSIENAINSSDYIVIGWGDAPPEFNAVVYSYMLTNTIKLLKKCNKDIFAFTINDTRRGQKTTLTKKHNPIHVVNGNIMGIKKVSVNEVLGITLS